MLNLMRWDIKLTVNGIFWSLDDVVIFLKKKKKRSYRFLICNDWDQGVLQNEPHNVTQYEGDDQMTVDNVPQAS